MTLPFAITLPHCSDRVPSDIKSTLMLDDTQIMDSVDLGTAEIFGHMPAEAVLSASWCRLVVDLNRDHRQRGERGVVPRFDYEGRSVYLPGSGPDEKELARRLDRYYFPFHQELTEQLNRTDIKGLLDCHSMNPVGPGQAPDAGMRRKDIVLSNNGNVMGEEDAALGEITCPGPIMREMKALLENAGFSVLLNSPYTGGFIIGHYGPKLMPRGGLAVQIEVNQDLYVDAGAGRPSPEKTAGVGAGILKVLERVAGLLP
ncbi:MAG: N-formylglutamate amidohydrolase [Deltaproteobacteria bacterium]|nr:N-formylglutamate amidohydrolase [Deltaproteobacteria bacterium]MBW1817825.1 N-formylglutamate amidohydrolase [Deltaproteobacteria bacterium]MBW2284726.1 N-formylglutamate amidohydrolase [Deltaproteobacteria bacterium]